MNSFEIASTFLALVVIAGLAGYIAVFGSYRVSQERFAEMALRLKQADSGERLGGVRAPQGIGPSLFRWALRRTPMPKASPATDKITRLLIRAGFIRSETLRTFQLWRFISLILAGTLGLLIAVVLSFPSYRLIMAGVGGFAVGYYLPLFYLRRRANKRQRAIGRELSDVLDLLVVCVEAGLGLFEAIKIVGDETARHGQAIGTELALVTAQVSSGGSLSDALRALAERTSVEDLKPLAATLVQSEQLGTQIGPALRSSSDSLRSKRRYRAEEAAQKCTIKILFPLVLFILPAMLIVLLAPALIQTIRTLNGP